MEQDRETSPLDKSMFEDLKEKAISLFKNPEVFEWNIPDEDWVVDKYWYIKEKVDMINSVWEDKWWRIINMFDHPKKIKLINSLKEETKEEILIRWYYGVFNMLYQTE